MTVDTTTHVHMPKIPRARGCATDARETQP